MKKLKPQSVDLSHLIKIIKKGKYSKYRLAKKVGVAPSTIGRILSGKVEMSDIVWTKISKALFLNYWTGEPIKNYNAISNNLYKKIINYINKQDAKEVDDSFGVYIKGIEKRIFNYIKRSLWYDIYNKHHRYTNYFGTLFETDDFCEWKGVDKEQYIL